MRTLILGGTGMLGRAVLAEARQRAWPALAPSHGQVDISNAGRLSDAIASFRPELIVNCAAFTKVDDCETRRDYALAVNGDAVTGVVQAAEAIGARVIHLSSDYVFNGRAESPYREDAATEPLSVYGESKLLGGKQALESAQSLVRAVGSSDGGPNFADHDAQTLRRQRNEGASARGRGPVRLSGIPPFLAVDLRSRRTGATDEHYRNRDAVSWHGFATTIAGPRATPAVAARPQSSHGLQGPYSVLDVQRRDARRSPLVWSAINFTWT